MRLRTTTAALVLAAVTVTTSWPSFAQFPGGGSKGGMRGDGPPRGGVPPDRTAREENVSELVEFRLQLVEELLNLTVAQQAPWNAYATKVRALAADITRDRERARTEALPQALTAVQQMDRTVNVARNRLTALEDIAVAGKALYESLSPQQKALVDSRTGTILPLLSGEGAPRPGPPAGATRPPQNGGGLGPPAR